MNGYLVLLRHEMDDLPVRLFSHTKKGRQEACLFAGRLNPMPTAKIRKIFNTNCSTPVMACVVEFVNGQPTEVIASVSFDE